MIKKFVKAGLSLLLVSSLLLGSLGGGSASASGLDNLTEKASTVKDSLVEMVKSLFSDVKGHWAESSIRQMFDRGVVTGFPDGTFRPDDRVTTEQFATMMLRSLWVKGSDGKLHWDERYLDLLQPMDRYYLENSAFDPNNIPSSKKWSEPYIKQLENMHLFSRYTDVIEGKMDKPLTREVASYMFREFIHQTEYQENRNYADLALQAVSDASNINPSIKYDVELSIIKGMMRGYPDKTFRPKGYITRAEASVIVDRLLNKSARDPYKPDLSHNFYTTYETDRGTKYFVFNSKEFADVWAATLKASEKTNGYAYANGLTFQFYKAKEDRDEYLTQLETDLFNFFIPDPYELSLGIGASERDYYLAKDANSSSTLHDTVFNDFVTALFSASSSDFISKFNQYVEDYKKDKSIKPRDYMIGNRSVRIMREGTDGKIIAYISEKK